MVPVFLCVGATVTGSCLRCGQCCRLIVINVTHSDIVRWHSQRRGDILGEVSYIDNYPVKGKGGFYIEKTARFPKRPCPFLTEDNLCSINDTKPGVCFDAPLGYKSFGVCPVFEKSPDGVVELIRNKQAEDFLMAKRHFESMMAKLVEARSWEQ